MKTCFSFPLLRLRGSSPPALEGGSNNETPLAEIALSILPPVRCSLVISSPRRIGGAGAEYKPCPWTPRLDVLCPRRSGRMAFCEPPGLASWKSGNMQWNALNHNTAATPFGLRQRKRRRRYDRGCSSQFFLCERRKIPSCERRTAFACRRGRNQGQAAGLSTRYSCAEQAPRLHTSTEKRSANTSRLRLPPLDDNKTRRKGRHTACSAIIRSGRFQGAEMRVALEPIGYSPIDAILPVGGRRIREIIYIPFACLCIFSCAAASESTRSVVISSASPAAVSWGLRILHRQNRAVVDGRKNRIRSETRGHRVQTWAGAWTDPFSSRYLLPKKRRREHNRSTVRSFQCLHLQEHEFVAQPAKTADSGATHN